ncbi:hypothetical protein K402DRAFT_369403 [Aulographum hederae CBS 113979]|uniref:HD/PDEase domain-containing protein n=1 Tax=Aulographum hederae CBS 113979 TaxID=1176131 RepID=A0A6G1HBK5_9PEZI|nr:hypothetical protein K402DRAFT_369403 [Aulographum hederae CBS 113979]
MIVSNEHALVSKVEEYVEEYMSNFDPSHDYNHIKRVSALAMHILEKESVLRPDVVFDNEAVCLAALCHDVGDRKYLKPGEDSSTLVHQLLVRFGAAPELAQKVQLISTNVSFSNEKKNPELVKKLVVKHPELGIVQDADRIDAIGAVGIGRVFAYGAAKAPERGMQGSIDHFGEKLELLGEMCKTETGKDIAAERTRRLRDFKSWWADETALADLTSG